MKKINTTISSFESLRSNNNVYIDKTQYLYDMLKVGDCMYFAARPRRFGKTLTISTLEAMFKGRRELFEGLYISTTDYSWRKHPVIHIDFGKADDSTVAKLEEWLNCMIVDIGKENKIRLTGKKSYKYNLDKLVSSLAKKAKVVVLIDEYDKPLSSNYKSPEVEKIRDVIRGFFEVLKASYDYLRFVFITGVTKYAKVSIFSSMNNLNDISMNEHYASLFGYTQSELEKSFAEYIDKGVRDTGMSREEYLARIKAEYDGYVFSRRGERVYNPVSVSSFFCNGGIDFDNYWVSTGGNAYLICDIAKRVNFNIVADLSQPASSELMSSYDIVEMAGGDTDCDLLKSLMCQSGYLTISRYDSEAMEYYLDFPNGEVRKTFVPKLLGAYVGDAVAKKFSAYTLLPRFAKGDVEKAIQIIKSIFAAVPNEGANKLNEYSYALGFGCMMRSLGADIDAESSTNKGRIDCTLFAGDNIYIIEFKVGKGADEAIRQIKDRGYVEKYEAYRDSHRIHLLGINFSLEERNIDEWKISQVNEVCG